MTGFHDLKLSWGDEEFTVPADRQMGLVMNIEDALTKGTNQQAITLLMSEGGPSYARLSAAFAAALRYAGADVSDDDVYLSIVNDLAENKGAALIKVQGAVLALLSIIAPPISAKIRKLNAEALSELDPGKK